VSSLLFLVPLSLLLLVAAIAAFAWAVRHGQFDDLDTPALDVLAVDPVDQRTGNDGTQRTEAAVRGDARQ